MDTDLGCYYGLYVTGGTLALDGFFAFRGTSDGVRCDRHVTVRGELTAIGAGGDGVHITGGDSDGLELLQCFVTQTTVIAEGGTNAVSLSSTALLPNGLELVEPAGGWIEDSTKYIRDSNSAIAKHAVLRIERLADGGDRKRARYERYVLRADREYHRHDDARNELAFVLGHVQRRRSRKRRVYAYR